jgi:hypothetical protein
MSMHQSLVCFPSLASLKRKLGVTFKVCGCRGRWQLRGACLSTTMQMIHERGELYLFVISVFLVEARLGCGARRYCSNQMTARVWTLKECLRALIGQVAPRSLMCPVTPQEPSVTNGSNGV